MYSEAERGFSREMKMSGPNGDPEVRAEEGILEDEDDFNEEGELCSDTFEDESGFGDLIL